MSHVYKGYASTYHVRILKYFNPELQLNNAESASKNILIDLLSQLRGFKFVIALALEFKKKVMMKQNTVPFILTQKQKLLLMK